MLVPEELVVEVHLGIRHPVVGVGIVDLHEAVNGVVDHLLALHYEGVVIDREAQPAQPARTILNAGAVACVVELPDDGLQVVVLLHQVGNLIRLALLLSISLLLLGAVALPENVQQLVDVLYHLMVRLRRLVWRPEVRAYHQLILIVVRLLGQALEVLVKGVDVVAVSNAVHGLLVEVGHLRVVLVDLVVVYVIDPELQFVLFEEGLHLVHGQALLDILLRPAQQLQDGLPGDHVLGLVRV